MSNRVTNGSISKGSSVHNIFTEGTLSGSFDTRVDGRYVNDYAQIENRVSVYPRSNASDYIFVGEERAKSPYDDNRTPEVPGSGETLRTDWGLIRTVQFSFGAGGFELRENGGLVFDKDVLLLTRAFPLDEDVNWPTDGSIGIGMRVYIRSQERRIVYDVLSNPVPGDAKYLSVQYNSKYSNTESLGTVIPPANYIGIFLQLPNLSAFNKQRLPKRKISHAVEMRDLGQTDVYNNDKIFTDIFDIQNMPEIIVATHPMALLVPETIVNASAESRMDGVIEPLGIRSYVDLSNTDIPFRTRGIRGSLVVEDPFRRSQKLEEGYDMSDAKAVPYLDGVEYFVVGDQISVELPPIFHQDERNLKPFVDTSSFLELYFSEKEKLGITISTDIQDKLKSGTGFSTDNEEEFEVYGSRGADFIGGGTDSLNYGGLKK